MLTIALNKTAGKDPLYEQLYQHIKNSITKGEISAHTKLPSKRALAAQLGISIITVANSYGQLQAEGYIYSKPKSGFYVSPLDSLINTTSNISNIHNNPEKPASTSRRLASSAYISPMHPKGFSLDLSSNSASQYFPFQTWSRLLRQALSQHQPELLQRSPAAGLLSLRQAICQHLKSFRGMEVNPEQVIIGAGTEYLYDLLIKLLGRNLNYCVEDPGYKKLLYIYEDAGACCSALPIDEQGISLQELNNGHYNVLHISPSHHFPTGIVTPVARRYELLAWAEHSQSYIIEDDYDTEFRLTGKPIPSLFSMDKSSRVIYLNTFSQSLTPTIRISYMILPLPLLEKFNHQLSYLSCSVSNFEQYTLAQFIIQGYFERHINRTRNSYKKLRQQLLRALTRHPQHSLIQILPQASGLYFLLRIHTTASDDKLEKTFASKGIRIQSLRHYFVNTALAPDHTFVMNYSSITQEDIPLLVNFLFDSIGY